MEMAFMVLCAEYHTIDGATFTATDAIDLAAYLRRHHCGDWGDGFCDEDKQANENSLKDGTRLLSGYHVGKGRRLYIITEWDRSSTCALLPEEY
ncbi:MAG: hypothetical protein NTW21_37380 [Verrucomicrobia bacterium]|nr:hypothetical protein [Verrucomicrobiota bacterium]